MIVPRAIASHWMGGEECSCTACSEGGHNLASGPGSSVSRHAGEHLQDRYSSVRSCRWSYENGKWIFTGIQQAAPPPPAPVQQPVQYVQQPQQYMQQPQMQYVQQPEVQYVQQQQPMMMQSQQPMMMQQQVAPLSLLDNQPPPEAISPPTALFEPHRVAQLPVHPHLARARFFARY